VTVVLAFKVTVQVTVEADVHPVHELNGLPPAVLGAVSVTEAPESYVRQNLSFQMLRRCCPAELHRWIRR